MKFIITLILLAPTFLYSEIKVEKHTLIQNKKTDFDYGSGIEFRKKSTYGSTTFYLIPSGEFVITNGKEKKKSKNIPHIAIGKIKKNRKDKKAKFTLEQKFPIYFEDDKKLKVDLEGIATDKNETAWIVDELNHSILRLSLESGIIDKQIDLSKYFDILNKATDNRGLEGITVTPDGKIYISMQSVIDKENSIRLFEYDPKNSKTNSYEIFVDKNEYLDVSEIKIGDIQAIDNNRFLIAEHGLNKKEKYISRIFLITKNNNEIQKELLVNLSDFGWKYSKTEGLGLIDSDKIAVTNDISEFNSKTHLWIVTLDKPLFIWSWKDWAIIIILLLIFLVGSFISILFLFKKK